MEEILVKTVELSNGLKVEIFDASIKIAKDRYKVVLIARIGIDVAATLASPDLPENFDSNKIERALPPSIAFEQKNERFFVDEKDKEAVFEGFLKTCLSHAKNYYGRIDFPVKFILKTYREVNP